MWIMPDRCWQMREGDGKPKALHATLEKEDMLAFRNKLPFLDDADRFGVR